MKRFRRLPRKVDVVWKESYQIDGYLFPVIVNPTEVMLFLELFLSAGCKVKNN